MGKLARASLEKEDLLYSLFGINAELLIDHAWGWEPCTMDLVKAYRPETKSFSRGQVLSEPYDWKKARIVVLEMAEAASLHLVERHLAADQIVLTVSYDAESLANPSVKAKYKGAIGTDHYGRPVPKHAQGTANLGRPTSSTKLITEAVASLYDSITDRKLLVRRLNISTNHVVDEAEASEPAPVQLELFSDREAEENKKRDALEKERRLQEAQLAIKRRYGKNAILKGIDFEEGATTRERNAQIGGHKA
jgi:DNA polymerase V